MNLARCSPVPLEIALGPLQHEAWETNLDEADGEGADGELRHRSRAPEEVLGEAGWRVVDALARCATMDTYRDYLHGSLGEWSVAKSGYVTGRSGWFSCRSACYLASGRPVVVQDTGFKATIPAGEGILTFDSRDEALDAIAEVAGNYERHAARARELAAAYFDSDLVLGPLLDEATQMPHPERYVEEGG